MRSGDVRFGDTRWAMTTESTHSGESVATASTSRGSKWRSTLDLTATVLVSLAAVAVLWTSARGFSAARAPSATTRPETPVPTEPQSLPNAAVLGSPTAKVVILEYSDFQCPFCGRFAREVLPSFEKEYVAAGKARIAFRHVPLEQAHPFALGAAAAAVCAGQQGRFWPFHDAVFQNQLQLDPPALRGIAESISLDLGPYDRCVADSKVVDAIRADVANAKSLGVMGTPTFFVGVVAGDGRVVVKQVLTGVQTERALGDAVDNLIR